MRELVSPGSFRWDIRESYAAMAERLRVDEETVRRGVNRARETGFLREVQLVLNPHILELESTGIQVEIDDAERKSSAVSQIAQVEGVVSIINFIGRPFRAILYYPVDQGPAKAVHQINAICNSKGVNLWKEEFPPCDLRLHATDWQMIGALRKNPRRMVSEIAGEVGVSTKTVKRRLTMMTQEKAFYLLPELNYDKYPGVAASVLVNVPDPTKKTLVDKQVRARLEKRLVFSRTDTKVFSMFTAVCVNMSEADQVYRWIRGLDGVKDVRMDFIKEIILPKEWLDREIEKHLVQVPAAVPQQK